MVPPQAFVVAHDIGTTTIRAAIATVGALDARPQEKWQGRTTDSVPCEFAYLKSDDNDELGNDVYEFSWGYSIPDEAHRFRFPKQMMRNLNDKLPGVETKTWRDGLVDLLAAVNVHTKKYMVQCFGEQVGAWNGMNVLTVPAIWEDEIKDEFYKIAQEARMRDVHMITEPEAAAVFEYRQLQTQNILKNGGYYVILDAGGGTVDLITYQIHMTQEDSTSPLQLEEAVPGDGLEAGGAFIDQAFIEKIKNTHGDEFKSKSETDEGRAILHRLLLDFREKKSQFPTSSSYTIGAYGLKGVWTLAKEEMQEMFDEQYQKIKKHLGMQLTALEEHRKATAAGVILVGGFGSSDYIAECLRTDFPTDTPILQCSSIKTAVVKGAVYAYLHHKHLIRSRKARFNYGMVCRRGFNPKQHPKNLKSRDQLGYVQAHDQIEWIVRKGDDLVTDKQYSKPFEDHFPLNQSLPTEYEVQFVVDEAGTPTNLLSPSTRCLRLEHIDLSEFNSKVEKIEVSTGSRKEKIPDHRVLRFSLGIQYENGRLSLKFSLDGIDYPVGDAEYGELPQDKPVRYNPTGSVNNHAQITTQLRSHSKKRSAKDSFNRTNNMNTALKKTRDRNCPSNISSHNSQARDVEDRTMQIGAASDEPGSRPPEKSIDSFAINLPSTVTQNKTNV